MTLLDAFLQNAAGFNIWIAARTDSIAGTGSAQDPINAGTHSEPPIPITLAVGGSAPLDREAVANTTPLRHGFQNGDLITISGVTGADANLWNGTFGIYSVSDFSFKYYMKKPPAPFPPGTPTCTRLTLLLDRVMRALPANVRIQLGPGVFQTRGFAPNDARGWQPKSGQKIIGAGVDVTTLQLVGAENADQHYHVIGMPIEPSGTTAITPLDSFEISDLTIDANVDNQPTRLDRYPTISVSNLSRSGTTATATVAPGHGLHDGDVVAITGATGTDANLWNGMFGIGNVHSASFDYKMSDIPGTSPASGSLTATKMIPYPIVACGAVRIFSNHARVSRVKAINWGTKSLKQGCFVISIIDASGQPTGTDGNPIITETMENGIEDCIAVQPSRSCARETTVLHLGGVKNSSNHAQGFAGGPFIRRNFVDCQFQSTPDPSTEPPIESVPYSSGFITSKIGTLISGNTGTFVGKRPHFHIDLDINAYARFYNPRETMSRWNGYFQTNRVGPTNDKLLVTLGTAPPNTTDDSSLVIMGTEFRAIAVTSGINAVVEQNQIHNCWIGGPYQSPLDDSVTEPSTPPTLSREEHLDPLNALNTRSLVVRFNTYKNVAIGPYFNAGGVSGAIAGNTVGYEPSTGVVTVTTAHHHKLWLGARVLISFATAQPAYDGLREIVTVADDTFSYQATTGLTGPSGTASYQVVSGIDFLTIENNVIELADLDGTEFAIKEYPLAPDSPAQTYRAYGIVVGDNGLSKLAGPYAHRQVFIHRNTIRYLNTHNTATVAGLGDPAGAGMQLAGIGQLQVTHNVLDTNIRNTMRTFRCGNVRFFNNKRPDGRIRPGWKGETNGYYDEPEALVEDALVLTLLQRGKR